MLQLKFRIPDFPLGALFATSIIILALLFALPDVPYPWLWQLTCAITFSLCLLGAGILGDQKSPTENAIKEETASKPQDQETNQRISSGPSADFAALINTIRQEGKANRAEEQSEDRKRQFLEILTIGLVFLTVIGIFRQVDEMIKVYGPIKDSADAAKMAAEAANTQAGAATGQLGIMQGQLNEMLAETRPWVYADIRIGGAIYRNQSGGLTIPIAFILHNTGHLPAMYVSPDIEGYLSGEGGILGSQVVRGRQQKRCSRPLQQPDASDQIGITVFPGQSVLFGAAIGITSDEVDEVRKLDEKTFGKEMDLFPSNGRQGASDTDLPTAHFIKPALHSPSI